MSSTAIVASICQTHESCTGKATALPRPYRWKARTTCSCRDSVVPVSSTVAPGLTRRSALTALSCGSSFHRAFEASSVGASCVTGNVAPSRVGRTVSCTTSGCWLGSRGDVLELDGQHFGDGRAGPARLRQTSGGRRSSAGCRRACSRSPPACAADRARTTRLRRCPRMIARYENSSSRVFGKPPTSSSGLPTSRRRYFSSAVRCRMTTCRFLSSSTARRMNFTSKRGSPSRYSTFSRASVTSTSASRTLFCATCSSGLRRDTEPEQPRAGVRRR